MNISILSVFPKLYEPFLQTSLIARAEQKKLVSFNCDSFFSFVDPKERIDAPIFGHGAGMLLKPEVIERAISAKTEQFGKPFTIFFSPAGKKVDQFVLNKIADTIKNQKHILLVAGRYEGIDARVEQQYADEILSIGDFVVMGGDLPAMLFLEGMLRLIPGVIGKQESVEQESFIGPFVDCPHYTEPVVWRELEVPPILRSGNHAAIEQWRTAQAAEKSILSHFEWVRSHIVTEEDKTIARQYIPPHYAALMHTDVLLPTGNAGTTSVTSMDIHDIARSARTYDLKHYSIVTPLHDQQQIVQTLLDFWQEGYGIEYNRQRHEAVKLVSIKDSLDAVIADITTKEGVEPIIVATSARSVSHKEKIITYYDQEVVWQQKRPVLFLFGTGKGLSQECLKRCDYVLLPIEGFSDFNHLSVRSAAAVVFDRWFGINLKIKP